MMILPTRFTTRPAFTKRLFESQSLLWCRNVVAGAHRRDSSRASLTLDSLVGSFQGALRLSFLETKPRHTHMKFDEARNHISFQQAMPKLRLLFSSIHAQTSLSRSGSPIQTTETTTKAFITKFQVQLSAINLACKSWLSLSGSTAHTVTRKTCLPIKPTSVQAYRPRTDGIYARNVVNVVMTEKLGI